MLPYADHRTDRRNKECHRPGVRIRRTLAVCYGEHDPSEEAFG